MKLNAGWQARRRARATATLGFEVIALNVTKLGSDNIDPRDYIKRLEDWKLRVEASGGHWRVINDLDRLDPVFLG